MLTKFIVSCGVQAAWRRTNLTFVKPECSTQSAQTAFVEVVQVFERTEHRPVHAQQQAAQRGEIRRSDQQQPAGRQHVGYRPQDGARIEEMLDRVEHRGRVERARDRSVTASAGPVRTSRPSSSRANREPSVESSIPVTCQPAPLCGLQEEPGAAPDFEEPPSRRRLK